MSIAYKQVIADRRAELQKLEEINNLEKKK